MMLVIAIVFIPMLFINSNDKEKFIIPPAPSINKFYDQEIKKIDNFLSKKPSLSSLCKESYDKHWLQRWCTDRQFFADCIHVSSAQHWLPYISEQNRKIEREKIDSVVEEITKMEYEFKRNFLKNVLEGKIQ